MSDDTGTDDGGSSTNESGQESLPEPTASRRRVLQATAGGTLTAGASIWSRGTRAQDVQSSPAVVDRTVHVGAISSTTPRAEDVWRERVVRDRVVRNYLQHYSTDHVFHGLAHGDSSGMAVENYERPYEYTLRRDLLKRWRHKTGVSRSEPTDLVSCHLTESRLSVYVHYRVAVSAVHGLTHGTSDAGAVPSHTRPYEDESQRLGHGGRR
jgi:hypothetical protein